MNSPLLLYLETATGVCSVMVARGEVMLAERTSMEEREHAAMLAVYIEDVLNQAGVKASDLDGVVVSKERAAIPDCVSEWQRRKASVTPCKRNLLQLIHHYPWPPGI